MWSKCLLVVLLLLRVMVWIMYDIEGRPALPPSGVFGVFVSLLLGAIMGFLYWHAMFGGAPCL
jgi:hypothetical protein